MKRGTDKRQREEAQEGAASEWDKSPAAILANLAVSEIVSAMGRRTYPALEEEEGEELADGSSEEEGEGEQ